MKNYLNNLHYLCYIYCTIILYSCTTRNSQSNNIELDYSSSLQWLSIICLVAIACFLATLAIKYTRNLIFDDYDGDNAYELISKSLISSVFLLTIILLSMFFVSTEIFYIEKNKEEILQHINNTTLIINLIIWVLLLLISIICITAIREKFIDANKNQINAFKIAIVIGIYLVILLFVQPYLNKLFGDVDSGFILQSTLFTGGAVTGWMVWYLNQLKKQGDFFYILLMTIVAGLSWYARLTDPEEVKLTASAFVLGSLFRVAMDILKKVE